MTEDELLAIVDADKVQIEDLTAERDSLAEELEQLKAAHLEAQRELAETKKLNFTLARQVNTGNADPESILGAMLKRR